MGRSQRTGIAVLRVEIPDDDTRVHVAFGETAEDVSAIERVPLRDGDEVLANFRFVVLPNDRPVVEADARDTEPTAVSIVASSRGRSSETVSGATVSVRRNSIVSVSKKRTDPSGVPTTKSVPTTVTPEIVN